MKTTEINGMPIEEYKNRAELLYHWHNGRDLIRTNKQGEEMIIPSSANLLGWPQWIFDQSYQWKLAPEIIERWAWLYNDGLEYRIYARKEQCEYEHRNEIGQVIKLTGELPN